MNTSAQSSVSRRRVVTYDSKQIALEITIKLARGEITQTTVLQIEDKDGQFRMHYTNGENTVTYDSEPKSSQPSTQPARAA